MAEEGGCEEYISECSAVPNDGRGCTGGGDIGLSPPSTLAPRCRRCDGGGPRGARRRAPTRCQTSPLLRVAVRPCPRLPPVCRLCPGPPHPPVHAPLGPPNCYSMGSLLSHLLAADYDSMPSGVEEVVLADAGPFATTTTAPTRRPTGPPRRGGCQARAPSTRRPQPTRRGDGARGAGNRLQQAAAASGDTEGGGGAGGGGCQVIRRGRHGTATHELVAAEAGGGGRAMGRGTVACDGHRGAPLRSRRMVLHDTHAHGTRKSSPDTVASSQRDLRVETGLAVPTTSM